MTPWSQEAATTEEQYTETSKMRAYEAGKRAGASGQPICQHYNNGWGYPRGKYFAWFELGFYGHEYRSDNDATDMRYAELRARRLISQAYRDIGRHSKAEAVLKPAYSSMTLKAFADYIERVE